MPADSSWTRSPKTKTAIRGADGDRITLTHQGHGWVVLSGSRSQHLEASADVSLDGAIDLLDQLYPPEGWECRAATIGQGVEWARPGWVCWQDHQALWRVGRYPRADHSTLESATGKTFQTADRARHWAEVRLDRTSSNLRGPRTRAQQRAVKTLPDVRVTEIERAAAVALAARLGLSYSDLARAALRFLDRATLDGSVSLVRAGAQSELILVTT